MDENVFLCETLDEITEKHFRMAAVAAMADAVRPYGILGVSCGCEIDLWIGKEKGLVQLRNWSGMLSLLIVSESGTWLVSSHIDGVDADYVLSEAYRQFMAAKPHIKTYFNAAFRPVKISREEEARWLEGVEDDLKEVTRFVKQYHDGRKLRYQNEDNA